MNDPQNPRAGGLWARLFHVNADNDTANSQPETPAPETPAPAESSPPESSPPEPAPSAGESASPDAVPSANAEVEVPPTVPDLDWESLPKESAESPAAPAKSAESAATWEAVPAAPMPPAAPAPKTLPLKRPPAPPANPPEVAAPPAGPLLCPSCSSVCKAGSKFCDDCGWMFAPDAGLALPSSSAPSITASRANPMPATSTVRLQGRYELGTLVNERAGINRYRGVDHGNGAPKPVTIVAAVLAPVAEVLLDDEATMVEFADEDAIIPGFDDDVPVAELSEVIPAGAAPWPSVAWEKDLLGKAVHPALPAVLDYFVEDNIEYLVEQIPEGRVLWDAWDDPETTADIRYGWMQQVCEGLQALHAAGAVLEGVRPDLVAVTPSGQAVLADLSDLLPVPLPPGPPIRATLYTAPELILDPLNADARSDLYSVGAMLYSLEYLHHALEEKDFERQFVPNQITERFPDVHPLFLRLINKTFCRDVHTRFPTDEAGKKDPTGMTELIDTLKICRQSFDKVRFDMAAWTTTGMVRTGNEDAMAFLHGVESRQDDLHEYALIILCDGMGGYEAGEVAAALAISEVREFLLRQPMFAALAGKGPAPGPVDVEATKQALEAALKHANKEVHTAGRTPGRGKRGMGCTAEVVYVDSRNVIVGHVGDSRTYHLRRGRLQQLTRDQTLVNRLVELGQLTAEEAENHPRKNELQQAIGGQPDVTPGSYSAKLTRGDWVLVCSDGLSNHISNQELEKMLTRETNNSAEEAARRLLNLVNLRGATDNATIVVVRAS
ncbi:MAG: protein phosphatase 2C domain-containing protein [Gemmataceae bacterium]|nr:protein phosphatase 2C domain-containing protein [Gemmataceae bacterium]